MGQPCCTKGSPSAVPVVAGDEQSCRAGSESGEEIRVDKILDIRRQLGEGTYSIAERLDVVVERIIKDLQEV
jgi:hypothetical protein